jgi:hypothetical protein
MAKHKEWKEWAVIYDAWKTLKEIVDGQVKIAESSIKSETDPERIQMKTFYLNELFKSQHELEHMMIRYPEESEI